MDYINQIIPRAYSNPIGDSTSDQASPLPERIPNSIKGLMEWDKKIDISNIINSLGKE